MGYGVSFRSWCGGVAFAAALIPWVAEAEPFVFVSLPDTQIYSENRFPQPDRSPAVTDVRGTGAIFFDQTQWIVDNAAALGIRYVGHLGDIVQSGNREHEWELAKDAMQLLLDADIPHGTVMGNHDDNDASHGETYMTNYLRFFGPEEFEDRPWFTASSPNGGANLQMFEHHGVKLGFLNFSIDHPQSEVDWATQIVTNNPDAIFVIGTHRYLYDFKLVAGRYGEDVNSLIGPLNVPANPVGAVPQPNDGEMLFHNFVSQHPNILMIHAGHFHAELLRLDGQNSAAQTVIQILTDYQSTRNGGDGYLRLYEMDFKNGTFSFDSYSPSLQRFRTTIDHFVETIFLAWDQRSDVMELLGVDLDGYLGLIDLLLKDRPAPDGFLLQHPDMDEPHEQQYYETYLDELFHGNPPEGFDDIHEWEGLWLLAFAANPADPFDFSDSIRSPRGTLQIDYSQYFVPSPEQLVGKAFDELVAAIEALERSDFLFRNGARALVRKVELVRRHAELRRYRLASRLLELLVLNRVDGCIANGRPDIRLFHYDLIRKCPAQEEIHPLVQQTMQLLDGLVEQ